MVRKLTCIISLIVTAVAISAQIPSNTRGAICVNELLYEDFDGTVPDGWEGDWMLLAPPFREGWHVQSGPSPDVPGTGADTAFSGSHYIYFESSGPAPVNSTFAIQTPPISLTDVNTSIRFRVLMHGGDIGMLNVNVLSGPGFTTSETVMTIVGEQHSSSAFENWEEAFVDIREYDKQPIRVEFEGMKMSTNQGDIAIDLVQVCSEPRVPTMSEWGLIILSLVLMIFCVVSIQNRSIELAS